MYKKIDIINALKKCDIKENDILFSHSNIGFFGIPDNLETADEICKLFYEAIFDVIGVNGTLIVPTFTYSFGSDKENKVFDILKTGSSMGIFAEYIRKLPDSRRSSDPMFSVAAIGNKAEYLTQNISLECFGSDSFWDRFYKNNGKICNLNLDSGSTFIHYVEKKLSVPYRKDYDFSGIVINKNGTKEDKKVKFFCRDLKDSGAGAKFEKFDILAKKKYTKTATLARGEVVVISAEDTFNLISETLEIEPNFLNNRGSNAVGS